MHININKMNRGVADRGEITRIAKDIFSIDSRQNKLKYGTEFSQGDPA